MKIIQKGLSVGGATGASVLSGVLAGIESLWDWELEVGILEGGIGGFILSLSP